MKKILTLLSLMTLMILSCGNGNTSQEKKSDSASTGGSKKYRIGITQIVAHPALDSAREGFKAAFKEAGIDADFDEKNANGEAATANLIANSFVSSKVDLIYSIATSTTQAAAQSTNTIPVVFSAITDPESAGILKNNVTGVSDRVDIKQQLQLLLKLDSKIKKVGVIYNSSEQNSKVQVDDLKAAAKELGIEVVEKSVIQASEIPQAADALTRESDAIYLPTDNLVASVVNLLTDKATAAKKIVFGAESAHVKGGALITQGIDYYEMGKQAGKIAIDILKNGKKPSEIKYQRMSLNDIVVNGKTMAALGITLPEDIKSKAKIIN
ncbi:ABC transporter substrate-binding protein [Leptotrichia sp. oral taxon 221]|uniref:ABC transporter substrate-binding protein n=1 Tax=Leptotrichia sp. oral taxon 221 TaxID=712362 RepID=UPI001B8D5E18|nr:ABC transporter substrate-binding protein [Leptotrichia sp. oral taxon 221]QUB97766.1 ABC transporter substrate-binding protein [Leptotrichia sp. oral taxon 221]